ncbi:hypothetical protein [Hafnia alvei]|uniref:Uncharacterized protein n=1 Tax=Hafnia alvei TaxID=569 RepID=A0A1C6Z157_HAFAL|nr:hypothetical protein [Hafnia alvei]NLS54021.1 hypothetical protein [Hafnia alvei]SCM52768.1 hypothetical protein BN1044_02252 [Hafnia alvei]
MLKKQANLIQHDTIDSLSACFIAYFKHYGKPKKACFLAHIQTLYHRHTGVNLPLGEGESHHLEILFNQAIKAWHIYRYHTYEHPTKRSQGLLKAGRVFRVNNWSLRELYQWSKKNSFDLFNHLNMRGAKRLQCVYLNDEEQPYYIRWRSAAEGIHPYDIIDFSWREIFTYRVIHSASLIVHNRCAGRENGVCVNGNNYRSIRDAYQNLMPNKSYGAICRQLRHGKTPDEAFDDDE